MKPADVFQLEGKRAVVTGAASGIGNAIAEVFASAGATVFLLDLDEAKAIDAAQKLGSKCHGIGCDVGEEDSVKAAFDPSLPRGGATSSSTARAWRMWEPLKTQAQRTSIGSTA